MSLQITNLTNKAQTITSPAYTFKPFETKMFTGPYPVTSELQNFDLLKILQVESINVQRPLLYNHDTGVFSTDEAEVKMLGVGNVGTSILTKKSVTSWNHLKNGLTIGVTALTHVLSTEKTRFNAYTRKVTMSGSSGSLRFPSCNITVDPDDQLLSIDIFIPFVPVGGASGHSISLRMCNTTGSTTESWTWSWNAQFLRQGWNSLRMWVGDTVSSTAGAGNLPRGVSHTVQQGAGAPFSFASAIKYAEFTFTNMTGLYVYLDEFRRGAKIKPFLCMGFDASGASASDDVLPNVIAPLFDQYGFKGYFSVTNVYDLAFAGGLDDQRKFRLYDTHGWDAVNHTWSHGGSAIGALRGVTLSRTGGVVTTTFSGGHIWAGTGNVNVGDTIYAAVSGATPPDMNGRVACNVPDANTLTYSAAGADGAATGTIIFSTFLGDVLNTDDALSEQLLRHEIVDVHKHIKNRKWLRAANCILYPNNSVPELNVLTRICKEAGIILGRGAQGGGVFVNEFGIDNPLHVGSYEFGSGTTATTLQMWKDWIDGAVGRGEGLMGYGHFALDETAAANIAHANADTSLPPGSGSNPAPPASGASVTGGWWYVGTFRRLLSEKVGPLVAQGRLDALSISQVAARYGQSAF